MTKTKIKKNTKNKISRNTKSKISRKQKNKIKNGGLLYLARFLGS